MRINIDFVRRSRRLSFKEACLLLGSLFATGVSIWHQALTAEAIAEAEKGLTNQRQLLKEKRVALSDEQRASVNQVIRQLNLPWPELLTAIEVHSSGQVALLSLEPDAAHRVLRVTAEAKSPEEMLEFVTRLGSDPLFVSAILQRHEINEGDRNRPYRFVVEATWKVD